VRYLWDAASEKLGIPPVTQGGGDEGVLLWRRTHTRTWNKILQRKPDHLPYNPDITPACSLVYERMINGMSTKFEQLPTEMTVEFEAWALLVLQVTWLTPAAQHSESTCGGKAYVDMMATVREQREFIAAAAVDEHEDAIEGEVEASE
jgi:hypothetical protein